MIPETLTLHDGTADVDFVKRRSTAEGSEWVNDASSLSLPEGIAVKHQQTGSAKNDNVVDRHLVQISRKEKDEETGIIHDLVLNVTVSVPRQDLFTTVEVERLFTIVTNLFAETGMWGRVLRNET